MGVYINKAELLKELSVIQDRPVRSAMQIIRILPTIDLVRCGECKFCDDKGKGRALICTNPYIDMDIHPLDFCSYGERRADDQRASKTESRPTRKTL